jgi:hypothetical protein
MWNQLALSKRTERHARASNFGTITMTQNDPRVLQLAGKIDF